MVCLAAGDNEEGFWIQLLVVVALAVGAGIYNIAKSRAKRSASPARHSLTKPRLDDEQVWLNESRDRKVGAGQPGPKMRDVTSGIELLGRDFLVGLVEQHREVDQRDIAMRRLCFAELVRRGQLCALSSDALKVYTLDAEGFYGKSIRCEAMRELASRTSLVTR
jgi:hypothetical protein